MHRRGFYTIVQRSGSYSKVYREFRECLSEGPAWFTRHDGGHMKQSLPHADAVLWDFEPRPDRFTSPPADAWSIQEFRKTANIAADVKLSEDIIKAKYLKQWLEFRQSQLATVIKHWAEFCRAINPRIDTIVTEGRSNRFNPSEQIDYRNYADCVTSTYVPDDREVRHRIPTLAVSQQGALLAFCERRVGLHDHAQNDIVLRRSHDGGKTWGPHQALADEGGDSLNDPCVVVLESGRILLRYTRFPKGVHARKTQRTELAEPRYGGSKNVRIYFVHSDDDGRTWSKPREVTHQVRRKKAISLGSPGIAIELTRGKYAGRIIYPNYEFYSLGGGRASTANSVSYSDDGGETWQLSGVINDGRWSGRGNEAQVVELADGSILMSARNQGGKDPYRRITTSRNGGQNWSVQRLAKNLMTPACMSSVIRYRWPDGDKPGLLLHSLPNTQKSRTNGTIFASRDEGKSWQKLRVLEPGGFAYSYGQPHDTVLEEFAPGVMWNDAAGSG